MKRKFKDFRCFGGWLTVKWSPKLLVWWSKDATPPSVNDAMNDLIDRNQWVLK